MTQERAEKIAATLIRQFSREKFFSISLPKVEDLELLGRILRTKFNCTVVWNYTRNKLSVYCSDYEPDALAEVSEFSGVTEARLSS